MFLCGSGPPADAKEHDLRRYHSSLFNEKSVAGCFTTRPEREPARISLSTFLCGYLMFISRYFFLAENGVLTFTYLVARRETHLSVNLVRSMTILPAPMGTINPKNGS